MNITIRTTWNVRFTGKAGEWPDLEDYNGRTFRPEFVEVEVIRQPWAEPDVYRISIRGTRVLRTGKLGSSTLGRGWAAGNWPFPDHYQVPDWAAGLAEKALAAAS